MTQRIIDPLDALSDEAMTKQLLALKAAGAAPHRDSPAGKRLYQAAERHQARQAGASRHKVEKIARAQLGVGKSARSQGRTLQESIGDAFAGFVPPVNVPGGYSRTNAESHRAAVRAGSRGSVALEAAAAAMNQANLGHGAGGIARSDEIDPARDPRLTQVEQAQRAQRGWDMAKAVLSLRERLRQNPAQLAQLQEIIRKDAVMQKGTGKAAKAAPNDPRTQALHHLADQIERLR